VSAKSRRTPPRPSATDQAYADQLRAEAAELFGHCGAILFYGPARPGEQCTWCDCRTMQSPPASCPGCHQRADCALHMVIGPQLHQRWPLCDRHSDIDAAAADIAHALDTAEAVRNFICPN